MANLSTIWTQGLDKETRDSFTQTVFSNYDNPVLIRLKEIVAMKKKALEIAERKPDVYNDISWSHKQAHNNGTLYALTMLEDILSFVK